MIFFFVDFYVKFVLYCDGVCLFKVNICVKRCSFNLVFNEKFNFNVFVDQIFFIIIVFKIVNYFEINVGGGGLGMVIFGFDLFDFG